MSEALDTMLTGMPDSYQKTVGFPTYDLLAAASIPLDAFAAELEEIRGKLDPARLTGNELAGYIKSRSGLERTAATHASGLLQAAGNGTISAGDIFESQGGVRFAAVETVEVVESGSVQIRCVSAGALGNVAAGSITMMPVQIAGIVSVTNPGATTGGYDAESDAAYYDRYLLRLQTPPTSGNQHHYRAWALEVAGVGGVQVYPLGHGDNTVDVVIINAEGRPADIELVDRVQAYIDPDSTGMGAGEAPIGAYCYVSAAAGVSVNLTVTVTGLPGAAQASVTETVKAAVTAYLKEIAFEQNYVSYAQIAAAILLAEGVQDFEGLTVNGGTGNVVVSARQVAVLGTVAVTYAA